MDIPDPDATHGPTQLWILGSQHEAERLAAALRAKQDDQMVVPPPIYALKLDKYVVTAIDVGNGTAVASVP